MAKFSKASDYIDELVTEVANETGLAQMGVDFEALCVPKAKEVVSVSKASSVVEFLSKRDDLVLVFIYERAFEKVDEKNQHMWIRMALDQVDVDTETGKVTIGQPMINVPLGCWEKWKTAAVESSALAQYTIAQIKDEDEKTKAEKAAQKKAKKNKE